MRVLLLAGLLLSAAAGATDVYRWVDADGQAHYSDHWQPGAEKIRIDTQVPGTPAAQARPAAPPSAPAASPGQSQPQPSEKYESIAITRPGQEEVLWNIEGQLPVSVRVVPELRAGDSLRIYLDGKQQESSGGGTDFQLANVFRGAHTLKAVVVSESGQVLGESPTTNFAVRQTSVLSPARPSVP